MADQQIKESIKKLWASGIFQTEIIIQALKITSKDYITAINEITISNLEDDKYTNWAKFLVQMQSRYVELDDLKQKAADKNKFHICLECIKNKADLDINIIKTGYELGIFDKTGMKAMPMQIEEITSNIDLALNVMNEKEI